MGKEGRWPHSCKVTATIHLDVHWEGEDVPSPFAILQWPKAIDDDATAALKKERENTPLRTEFHPIIHAFCSVRSKAPRHSHGERGGPLFIKSRSPDSQMFSSSRPTFFRASHRVYAGGVLVCVPILSAGLLICCTVFFLLPPAHRLSLWGFLRQFVTSPPPRPVSSSLRLCLIFTDLQFLYGLCSWPRKRGESPSIPSTPWANCDEGEGEDGRNHNNIPRGSSLL